MAVLDQSSPPSSSSSPTSPQQPGVWRTATLTLVGVPGGTEYRCSLRIDGVLVDDATQLAVNSPTRSDVRLGVFFTSPNAGEAQVVFDNLVVHAD
jgi:hypothetical protein